MKVALCLAIGLVVNQLSGTLLLGQKPGAPTDGEVNLQSLLKLAAPNHSISALAELYQATSDLESASLLQLSTEITLAATTDGRLGQVKEVVLTRFAQVDPDAALAYVESFDLKKPGRQRDLTTVASEIARQDFDKALSILRIPRAGANFRKIAESIAGSGVEGAREALFDYLIEREDIRYDTGYLDLFSYWAREDLHSAIANFPKIRNRQERRYAIWGIGRAITSKNLKVGLRLMDGITDASDRANIAAGMIGNIAAEDPQLALSLLDTHIKIGHRWNLMHQIGNAWFAKDPAAARIWIESLENPIDRAAALHDLYLWFNNTSGRLRPDSTWLANQLVGFVPSDLTSQLTILFMLSWTRFDAPALANWLKTQPDSSIRQHGRSALIEGWPEHDPAGAAEFFAGEAIKVDDTYSCTRFTHKIASDWGKIDHQAAFAWVESLDTTEKVRANIVKAVIRGWGNSAPRAAADFSLKMKVSASERISIIASLLKPWGTADFESARTWAEKLTDPSLQTPALNAAIFGYAREHPAEAAAALENAIASRPDKEAGKAFSDSIKEITKYWTPIDPPSAAKWTMRLPDSDQRRSAIADSISQWAMLEPNAIVRFLAATAPSKIRDEAVSGFVSAIHYYEPETAFRLAEGIADDERRLKSIGEVYSSWQNRNSRAANAALDRSGLRDQLFEKDPDPDSDPFSDL